MPSVTGYLTNFTGQHSSEGHVAARSVMNLPIRRVRQKAELTRTADWLRAAESFLRTQWLLT